MARRVEEVVRAGFSYSRPSSKACTKCAREGLMHDCPYEVAFEIARQVYQEQDVSFQKQFLEQKKPHWREMVRQKVAQLRSNHDLFAPIDPAAIARQGALAVQKTKARTARRKGTDPATMKKSVCTDCPMCKIVEKSKHRTEKIVCRPTQDAFVDYIVEELLSKKTKCNLCSAANKFNHSCPHRECQRLAKLIFPDWVMQRGGDEWLKDRIQVELQLLPGRFDADGRWI